MRKLLFFITAALLLSGAVRASGAEQSKSVVVAPSYAWRLLEPLGLHLPSTIDTLMLNYSLRSVPSAVTVAQATTGNIAAPSQTMILSERVPMSDFYFRDALSPWLPSEATQRFYNTRMPMTLVSYNFGGGNDNGQDRLQTVFSGNAGPRWQVGALLDYIHSKGSYANQAAKNLTWGASLSYMGERYQLQAFMYHYNDLCMDNGGITDPLYITDPAELQGGSSTINPKSIPTRLDAARTRLRGTQIYVNNRYNVGYWREDAVDDTTTVRTYVPVTAFIYTLDYQEGKHRFTNTNSRQAADFWKNTYLSTSATEDLTKYYSVRNTVGVSLLEGFRRWVHFGLAAYATYELRKFTQTPYEIAADPEAAGLTPFPTGPIAPSTSENNLWVGAQLTKQRGSVLTYDATGRIGMTGPVAGDLEATGHIHTRIPLPFDTLTVDGFASFSNREAPYLMKQYVSNHFVWDNDFGKVRRTRFGGSITVPRTGTHIEAGVENLQNYIYFGPDCLPVQHGGNVQVVSATLRQNLAVGVLHWDNAVTWQAVTDANVIPLPKLAVYSNLYLLFRVAGVLHVQAGVDCDYYTHYRGVSYQPATMAFYNQADDARIGNYPFMNLYINMKLSKARFYIMFSHINQGLTGKNYFSMPLYPLNPRRFQLGVSVDFAN